MNQSILRHDPKTAHGLAVTKLSATLCRGGFFGAALFISLVQHPAALETGNEFAAVSLARCIGALARLQASLALVGCASAIWAWLSGAGALWLAVAVVIGSVVPFTLIVIKPVNDALLRNHDAASEVAALLTRWGYLHWTPTVAGGLAFLLCLVG